MVRLTTRVGHPHRPSTTLQSVFFYVLSFVVVLQKNMILINIKSCFPDPIKVLTRQYRLADNITFIQILLTTIVIVWVFYIWAGILSCIIFLLLYYDETLTALMSGCCFSFCIVSYFSCSFLKSLLCIGTVFKLDQ